MCTVNLQLLSRAELLFRTYRAHVTGLSTELKNAEAFVTLPKHYSTTDTLSLILQILPTNKGNICGGLSFPYSYKWVD